MIRSRRLCLWCIVGVLGVMSALKVPQRAEACGGAWRQGTPVVIAEETAAIVWDSAHGIEHFIRKATFKTKAKDFGFLVPTPATPDLAESRDQVFGELGRLSTLPREESSGNQPMGLSAGMSHASAPVVEVIKSQRVGGLDAVVLAANDAGALSHWLRSHGYSARPALNEWLAAYVAARWKVTAFKIATDGGPADGVTSTVVRMSFPCSKPYFPYREPADQRQDNFTQTPQLQPETSAQKQSPSARALRGQRELFGPQNHAAAPEERLLKIYFLSNGPMEGDRDQSYSWPGAATWSRPVEEGERTSLAANLQLPPDQLPAKLWLTVFWDSSTPRPGIADVYFGPASPKRSYPFPETPADRAANRIHILIGTGALIVGFLILVWRGKRRQ